MTSNNVHFIMHAVSLEESGAKTFLSSLVCKVITKQGSTKGEGGRPQTS